MAENCQSLQIIAFALKNIRTNRKKLAQNEKMVAKRNSHKASFTQSEGRTKRGIAVQAIQGHFDKKIEYFSNRVFYCKCHKCQPFFRGNNTGSHLSFARFFPSYLAKILKFKTDWTNRDCITQKIEMKSSH